MKKASLRTPVAIALVALFSMMALPSPAEVNETLTQQLEFLKFAHVTEVVDGDTVILEDGMQVRLVGIMAPKLPLGREGFVEEPLAPEAKDALAELVQDSDVALYAGGVSQDRHGRILAHVFTSDGAWVQGELLDMGLARTYSFADNRALVGEMLAREATARDAGIGLWTDSYYAVRDAGSPGDIPVDRYELVEGVVLHAAESDRRIYLNFGEDWRQDMTATVSPDNRAIFRESGFVVEDLEGRRIRVRGWTQWYNGPVIDIDHPEQIEVLEQ